MKPESLLLTISIDDGKPFVLLNDTRRLSKFGWADADLPEIQNAATAVEPAVLQERVLPAPVTQAIDHHDTTLLQVQLHPELACLPIECFQSAGQRWCEKYALSCYLLGSVQGDMHDDTARNTSKERIQVILSSKLLEQDGASELRNHLTRNGLFEKRNEPTDNVANVLVACSAADARSQIHDRLASAPDLCVWAVDSPSSKSFSELADFVAEFPESSVLTGNNFSSAEESLVRLIPALGAMSSGLSPFSAIQSASQQIQNKKQSFRLYNREDVPLCSPPLSSQFKTENRTITAMSLDVVASTKLMHRLGNEQYSEVLAALKEKCIQCISERGGSHGGRAGDDSIMAYFGLPNALANTAVCAMDAALAVLDLLPNLPGHPELRIGIATGRVAVRSGVPYGTTIHLAARLQSYGKPREIMVDTASQWLARKSHEFEPCDDEVNFKGIDQPVQPIKLVAHARQEFTGIAFSTSAPFIGRAAELKELTQYWNRVCSGDTLVVCVRGETGIGKSRFVSEFLLKSIADGARVLNIRGLSDYHNGVFESIKESIKNGFGVLAGDSPSQVTERVLKSGIFTRTTAQHIATVSELLGISQSGRKQDTADDSQIGNSDSRLRQRLFESLTKGIESAASDRPLVVMVDDLQWIDPSSREALEYLIENLHQRSGLRCLFLCSERDDQTGEELPRAISLPLERLTPQVAHQFLRTVAGDDLPAQTIDLLVERAEGVPLYLEESARLILERPMDSSNAGLIVPESIDSLLMSRLDRLDMSGRYLVQIASAIGRDVQIALLRSVYALLSGTSNPNEFEEKILAFRENGVLGKLMVEGPPRLTFRHEMIRDVAYASMWQRDRITIHAAIAQVLSTDETQASTQESAQESTRASVSDPGLIAHHLSLSEQFENSARLWEQAARLAADASANQEAIRSLRSALNCLEQLPNNENTAKQAMRLQLMLGARLIASEGYGAEEVRCAYERAELLVLRYGEKREQLKVMLGLESVHIMRGELENAEALAVSAVDIAKQLPESKLQVPMIIQAKWALANLRFHQGQARNALALFDQCLEACHSIRHRSFVVQDPEIMCLCYGAWALWETGLADTAQLRIKRAVEVARAREHRFSEGEALGFYASVALFRGEYDAAIKFSDDAITICEQEEFATWLAHARIIKGRAQACSGHYDDGLALMLQGYEQWASTGAVITRAFYLTLIAETLLEIGKPDEAGEKVEEAKSIVALTGDCYHLAEVLRIHGLVAYARHEFEQGDSLMDDAINTATSQEKQAFALRSSTAMASSFVSRGRNAEAVDLMRKAVSPLTEGFSTLDVCRANELLMQWTASLSPATDVNESVARRVHTESANS